MTKMKNLAHTIKWDFILITKYGIAIIALVIAAIYSSFLLLFDIKGAEKLVTFLIFSDPVMYGFLFTAVMILFEKESHTHQVLAITPMPISQYIWSKNIVFTIVALVCSTGIILAARPEMFHPLTFILGVLLSSSLFVFVGIIGVSFVKNFNQFILLMPIVLFPVCLPLLDYFSIFESYIFYIIPTQACLLLFKTSISQIELWQIIYAITYLLICNLVCYKLSLKAYKKRILKISRHE